MASLPILQLHCIMPQTLPWTWEEMDHLGLHPAVKAFLSAVDAADAAAAASSAALQAAKH